MVTSDLYLRHTALLTGMAVELVFSAHHFFSWIVTSHSHSSVFRKCPLAFRSRQNPHHKLLCVLSSAVLSLRIRTLQSPVALGIHLSWRAGTYLGLYLPLGILWALGSDLNTPVRVPCQDLLGFWIANADPWCKCFSPLYFFSFFNCTILFIYLILLNYAIEED